ncbi:MAG: TonB-dependent receptor [Proteobacteria bacterium]|nr:TonB-dependent receptor [Pseudomonadota bacterium]
MKPEFRLTVISLSVAAVFAAPPVIAQTANSAEGEVQALQTVVVTAQKRQQSLQEVPISMTVLGEEALEKSRIRTLYDIQQLAPNFEAIQSPGWSGINVRGVGGGGRNVGWDTRVGVYLDGVYLGQSQALDQSLNDIDQIEILRGPQGHLFGRNTDAGAVSITTRAPSKEFEASVRGGVSNYGGREAGGSVSGPISAGVSGKFSVTSETRDGYTTNLYNGTKLDNVDRLGARGQLSFQPSQKLKVDLYADYSKINQNLALGEPTTGLFNVPLVGGPLNRRTVNFNTTPYKNSELSGLSMTINYALDGGNKLTAITGYRDTKQQRGNDTDYGPKDLFHVEYADHFKQTSQEIRLASPNSGKLRYVAGVYFLNEDAGTDRKAIVGQDTATIIAYPGLGNIPFGALGLAPGAVISNDGKIKTSTNALFGSVDYDFATDWTVNLGARYTNEKKDVLYNLNGTKSGGFKIATLNGYTDNRSESRVTPTVGVSYALSKTTNLYAKYSTGFKSGGWNTDFLSTAQVATGIKFDTETVKSYEAGVKGKLLGGRMQYDVAVFSSQFDRYQVFQFVQIGAATALVLNNAAKVDTRGIEASTRLRVSRDFDIGANLGILRAEYKNFPNGGGPGVDYSGQPVADTPKLTAALTATYRIPAPSLGGGFELSGDYSHRGSAVLGGIFPDLPARNLVNARLAYTPSSGKWSANLWARNLTNQDYVIARGQDFLKNQFDTRGLPRMVGVTAKYDF